MHLKILIGVLTLGLAVASPKAAPKPAAKASHQHYSSGQQLYLPELNHYGQHFAAHSFPGQHSADHYNVRLAPSSYGYSSGNPFSGSGYQQASGNYYQSSQLIPVPVGYSNDAVQSANYYGAARLWPKNAVSLTGSPSPQVYYASSTPSPIAYQTTSGYGSSPFVGNYPVQVSTPSSVQYPIPVPVKVDSRSSFQPQLGNFNAVSQNVQIPVSTPAPHLINYQQYSTPASYVQNYQQNTAAPYVAYQSTSAPSFAKYQQPTSSTYHGNYHQHSTPATYQVKYQQQPTAAPIHVGYQQHSTPAPYQVRYQQHSTPAPFQVSHQQYSTPAPYQGVQYSTVSPFAAYQQQPSASRYVGQYQHQTVSPGAHYHQPTVSAQYQRIPVPVAYPQSQVQILPTKSTFSYPVSSTPVYPSVHSRSQFVTAQSIPSSTPATVLVSSTPTPIPKATIIKSEYNSGYVSPQYNHIPLYSTASPSNAYLPQSGQKSAYGLSYAPAKSYSSYAPSTAVSHVNYNGLGHSYSY